MAVDTLFDSVYALVQQGSTENVVPPRVIPGYESLPWKITTQKSGVTETVSYMEFAASGHIELSQSGYQTKPWGAKLSIELVLQPSWGPSASLLESDSIKIEASPNAPGLYRLFWNTSFSSYRILSTAAIPKNWALAGEFSIPLSGRSYVRIYGAGSLNAPYPYVSATSISVYVAHETGGSPTNYSFSVGGFSLLVPMRLGAPAGTTTDYPSAANASANISANPIGVSTDSTPSKTSFFATFNRARNPVSGSVVIAGCGVTHSVNVTGKTPAAISAELAAGYVAALGVAGYSAGYSFNGTSYIVQVTPKASDPYSPYHAITITGSATFEAPSETVPVIGAGSTTQTAVYGAPPGVNQVTRFTVFVADESKDYTLTFNYGGVVATANLKNNLAGGLASIAAQLGQSAQFWTSTTPGTFVGQITNSAPGPVALSSALTENVSRTSAIWQLFAFRMTGAQRTDTGFPALPWPTSNIAVTPVQPGAAAYYYPFEQGNVNPIANSGSITSHSMTGGDVNLPPAVVSAPGGGYAMRINGSSTNISAGATSSAFAPLTGDFTLECWVYRELMPAMYLSLFSMEGVYVGVWGDSGQMFANSQNIGIAGFSGTVVIPDQTWAHLAVVRTGNTLKGYLNGTLMENELSGFGSGAVGSDMVGPTIGADAVFTNSSMPGYYDDFIVTGSAKYTANFTPAPRGSAFTTTPTTDVFAGSDTFLDDFLGTATLVLQANFPDSYATSDVTLDDLAVEQVVVVDGAQLSITANTTIANFTSVAAITVGTPVNWTADSTLADFTGTSDAVASTPIDTTADVTLEDVVADGLILFLAPSEMTADQVLDEFTSDGSIEVQEPNRLSAEITLPAFRVAASIVDGVLTGANITLPAFQVTGRFGMRAAIELPMFKMAGSATVSNVLRAAITLPTFQVQATASVAGQATANIALPAFQVAGYFGMGAAIELPAFTAAGSITVGSVLNAAIELPAFVVAGSISQPNTLRAEITLPAFTSGGFTVARITLPVFQVMGSVSPVLTAIYETYVVQMAPKVAANQTNDQVTRYTNYPFTQVVRYGNRYYGVATDGLYLLEGDTDNGTAIDWALETCTTDFGSPEKKNVEATFLGGKAGPVVNYTIKSGGSVDQLHASTITATDVHINHRQKYGRGRRERYYALGMAGQGDISIDSIEFEVATTSRRI